MERRRLVRAAAAGLAAATGLTASGCARASSADEENALDLVLADYGDAQRSGDGRRYWQNLVRRFRQRHPEVAVTLSVHDWSTIDRRVAERVAAGRPPDIAQLTTFGTHAEAGRLYDAGEVVPVPVQAAFVYPLARAGETRHLQYGLPFAASTRLFLYNRRLFARAGLDPDQPPRTWDELRDAAEALREADVEVPYGLPLGREEAQAEAMMWMLSNNGGYTDGSDGYTLDAPANLTAFTWLRESLVGRGLTQPDPHRTNRSTVFELFCRGRVGMLNGHPRLAREAAARGVDYGVAPAPGRLGPATASVAVADWVVAFRSRGRREQIRAFLDFLYSARTLHEFSDRYRLLPVTTEGGEWMRRRRRHRRLWPFVEELSAAECPPVGKRSWPAVSARVRARIGGAVTGDGDPAAVLADLQQYAQRADGAVA